MWRWPWESAGERDACGAVVMPASYAVAKYVYRDGALSRATAVAGLLHSNDSSVMQSALVNFRVDLCKSSCGVERVLEPARREQVCYSVAKKSGPSTLHAMDVKITAAGFATQDVRIVRYKCSRRCEHRSVLNAQVGVSSLTHV